MKAQIYGVDIDFFEGKTILKFGPWAHLNAQEFYELFSIWRWRSVWNNPNLRNSGNASDSSAAQLGTDTAKENSAHAPAEPAILSSANPVSGSLDVIQHDATAGQGTISIQRIDSGGSVDITAPQVLATMTDIGSRSGTGRIAKWRKIIYPVCSSGSVVLKQRWFLCTDEEPSP